MIAPPSPTPHSHAVSAKGRRASRIARTSGNRSAGARARPRWTIAASSAGTSARRTRIGTGRLNTWIKEVVAATPPPVRGGKQPRILFATQAAARPPTFVLFTSGFLEAGYRRFLERRLRETFGFEGSPIRINVRVREKRNSKSR